MNIKKTAYAVNLTLVLILCLVAIKLIFHTQNIPVPARAQHQENPSIDQTPNTAPQQPNSSDYTSIFNKNLFSSSESENPINPSLQTQKNDAETMTNPPKLDLELQGVISGPPQFARALIKDHAVGTLDNYRTGNSVGGARIVKIEKKSVVLEKNGREYVLKINNTNNDSVITQNQSIQVDQKTTPAFNLSQISMTVKNQLMEDILSNARIEPYLVNQEPQGLQITELANVENAKLLGLKDGDVIRLVNGQLITNKQKAFQVIRKARTQPFLDVELQRDGVTKAISFPPKKSYDK